MNGASEVVQQFGQQGHKAGQFDVSAGIALLPEERLAVADFQNHRVQIWPTNGEFLLTFGKQGTGNKQFERPTDVARAPNGDLYVVGWGNHRIQVFAQTGPEQ